MENATTIRIIAHKIQPDYEERLLNWVLEVYYPLQIAIPGYEQIDFYRIVRENPQYTKFLTIAHYTNRSAQLKVRGDQRWKDTTKDTATWADRSEYVWFVPYELISSIQKDSTKQDGKTISSSEDATIIQIEGYSFLNQQQERYDSWFNKWGREVYVIMRLPVLKD
jgi:hypothetical protein